MRWPTPVLDRGFYGERDPGKKDLYVQTCWVLDLALMCVYLLSQVAPLPPHVVEKPAQVASHSQNSVGDPPIDKAGLTFGVDLAEQMTRDGVDVPRIMQKCCEVIEKWGLESKGIYRLSGTHSKVQKLKERLDRGQ
jgi:RhoGAP domain